MDDAMMAETISLKEFLGEVIRAFTMAEDEVIMGPAESIKARFLELLEQHPELTRSQAYLLAVMEKVGYRGYLVPPELALGVLARLEVNDRQANLD